MPDIKVNPHVKDDDGPVPIGTQLEILRAKIEKSKPDSDEFPKLISKKRELAKQRRRMQLKHELKNLDKDFESMEMY